MSKQPPIEMLDRRLIYLVVILTRDGPFSKKFLNRKYLARMIDNVDEVDDDHNDHYYQTKNILVNRVSTFIANETSNKFFLKEEHENDQNQEKDDFETNLKQLEEQKDESMLELDNLINDNDDDTNTTNNHTIRQHGYGCSFPNNNNIINGKIKIKEEVDDNKNVDNDNEMELDSEDSNSDVDVLRQSRSGSNHNNNDHHDYNQILGYPKPNQHKHLMHYFPQSPSLPLTLTQTKTAINTANKINSNKNGHKFSSTKSLSETATTTKFFDDTVARIVLRMPRPLSTMNEVFHLISCALGNFESPEELREQFDLLQNAFLAYECGQFEQFLESHKTMPSIDQKMDFGRVYSTEESMHTFQTLFCRRCFMYDCQYHSTFKFYFVCLLILFN